MGVISNGTTLLDAGAIDSGIATGAMTLIKTLTASSSATLDFLNGTSNVVLDDTYKEYVFKFINIHPQTNVKNFTFQVDTGTNTSYNQAMTTTQFNAQGNEADDSTGLGYNASGDQAQGTAFQSIMDRVGSDADSCVVGSLHLFNPSSTTFVKHFIANCQAEQSAESRNFHTAGYVNTTTALTRVRFKFNSGNIDSGIIKLYGIK